MYDTYVKNTHSQNTFGKSNYARWSVRVFDCEKNEKSVTLFYFVLLNTYQIPTSHTFDWFSRLFETEHYLNG